MQRYRGQWRIKMAKYKNGEVFLLYEERGQYLVKKKVKNAHV
jgi:hypothetical protein